MAPQRGAAWRSARYRRLVGALALLSACGDTGVNDDAIIAGAPTDFAQLVPHLVVAGPEAALVVDGSTGVLLPDGAQASSSVRLPELQALSGTAFADGFALVGVFCVEGAADGMCDRATLLVVLLGPDGIESSRTELGSATGDQISSFGAALVGTVGRSLYIVTDSGLVELSESRTPDLLRKSVHAASPPLPAGRHEVPRDGLIRRSASGLETVHQCSRASDQARCGDLRERVPVSGVLESGEIVSTTEVPDGDVCIVDGVMYSVSAVSEPTAPAPMPVPGVPAPPGIGSDDLEGQAMRFAVSARIPEEGWTPVNDGVLDALAAEAPLASCAGDSIVAGTDGAQPRHRWTPDTGWRDEQAPPLNDAVSTAVSSTRRHYVLDSSGQISLVAANEGTRALGVELPEPTRSAIEGAAVPPGLFVDDSARVHVACVVINDSGGGYETVCIAESQP